MNFENVSSVDVEQAQYVEVKKTNSAMKMAGLFFFLVMILEVPLSPQYRNSLLGQEPSVS